MSSATLTLMGLYQYGINHKNVDIFEGLSFPGNVDKQLVITTLLTNGGDYELIKPDLYFMHDAAEFFSQKWQRTIEKWAELLDLEYEPLDNYDRKEAWSESTSESNHTSATDSTSSSTSMENKVSAFNSDVNRPESAATNDSNVAGTSSADSKRNEIFEHRGRVHGNIGVKTTQSIWMEQAEVVRFNIYEEIYKLYASEFLIPFTY